MNRLLGCLSAYGLFALLVLVAGVGIAIYLQGAALLSPGSLTAEALRPVSLQGYANHAEMERRCTLCHRPWGRADPDRCLACHTAVDAEIAAQSGVHGWLDDPTTCTDCHPDHRGREADIAHARLNLFPHERVGFTLRQHTQLAKNRPLRCEDCHTADYALAPSACASCHQEMNAAFAEQHTVRYGAGCLSCHDGGGLPEPFDHQAVLTLGGAHAQLECAACHSNPSPKALSRDCVGCHAEPEIHRGQFGTDCGACHTAEGWAPAQLGRHAFPLDHGQADTGPCSVCHPTNYVAYTCYGCHRHQPADTEARHREASIAELENCARCHPAGNAE